MHRLRLQSARPLLRSPATPASARSLSTTSRARSEAPTRHVPPKLPYGTEEGLGRFMSENTLNEVATVYQKGLLDRLSDLTKDTPQAHQSVLQNVVTFAKDRSKALEFNYASQALNNSFFLDMLKPPEKTISRDHQGAQSAASKTPVETVQANEEAADFATPYANEKELEQYPYLKAKIDQAFGGLTGLKSAFGAAGMGMSGSGWVWLVADSRGDLAVVATYGAGTMLVRSREQRGLPPNLLGEDRTTLAKAPTPALARASQTYSRYGAFPAAYGGVPSSPASGTNMRLPLDPNPAAHSRSIATSLPPALKGAADYLTSALESETNKSGPGYDLIPLLTCSIHEHCWLRDHGIWGKKEYLKEFWSVVDWKKVGSSYENLFGAARKYGA